jgi:predicted ester cyclase
MSAEQNMALARRFMEARVKGDVDALEEMLPPDFVSHTKLLPEEEQGREGVIWAAAQVAGAISNASVVVEDQVAQGDKVVTRFIVHSTHDRGEIMGLAPSGRQMTNRVILIPPHRGGQDSRGVGHRNDRLKFKGTASRAREDRARAHRA